MNYYEVYVADSKYHGDKALTYSFSGDLDPGTIVTLPLRSRSVNGFVLAKVKKPAFETKEIKNLFSLKPLPVHLIELAYWLKDYYACTLGQALRLLTPASGTVNRPIEIETQPEVPEDLQISMELALRPEQKKAIEKIESAATTTVLLHGETGSGKTRVYAELAKKQLAKNRSVIILTPEITLTSQLETVLKSALRVPVYVLHSQLKDAERRKIWRSILEAEEPLVVLGPRSALFSPINRLGLIVIDEAHEPAYKQEQTPRYQASRVASRLGELTGAKVVLGTATPSLGDYYLAQKHKAIARMTKPALGGKHTSAEVVLVDLKDRQNFKRNAYLSDKLIDEISTAVSAKKQIIVYLNRRGTSRLILCDNCGWQLLCPNCDIPLVYHGDQHQARCHSCGYKTQPPGACPECANTEVIYKSIGTKSLETILTKLFPGASISRFDADSAKGERLHELYQKIHRGQIDILVGTQLLAKGLDLPRLGLVGVISAESTLTLPDFTSEERTFQLLYQIIGRLGRGHGQGKVILQSYRPDNPLIKAAAAKNYHDFYELAIKQRQQFRWPPFAYLLKLTTRRLNPANAQSGAEKLQQTLRNLKLPVEIIGPAPSFYARRGGYYSWQLVIKSKQRHHLLEVCAHLPAGWTADLDPINLL